MPTCGHSAQVRLSDGMGRISVFIDNENNTSLAGNHDNEGKRTQFFYGVCFFMNIMFMWMEEMKYTFSSSLLQLDLIFLCDSHTHIEAIVSIIFTEIILVLSNVH